MNKTNDFKYNLPAYSDPVDIEDLNDNFRGIDDALMAGLCKKDYTGNNMGSSDPSQRKYAWAPWLEIVNDNEFDVVVTDRNAPVGSEEATINIAAGQTFRKYINGRYYMNFYVQDQHDVTFKWFTNAETYINESGGGGGGTGTVTSVSVQGGSGSHLTGSGNPIETSGTITINVDEGYSIPSDNEQDAWDGKAADLKLEINSSTYVITAQLKDASGNLIGNERTIDLPLESVVVSGTYDDQTKKVILTLQNGSTVEFSVADLVSGLQTELSSSNKLNPAYIAYDSSHRAVSDTEKNTWNGKQNALTFDDAPTQNSNNPVKSGGIYSALAGKQASLDSTQLAAVNSGIDSTKVEQISTNQTNILYAINNGVKNELDNFGTTSYESSGVTFTFNKDGSVHIKGTATGANAAFYYYTGIYSYISNIYKGHILSGVTGGAEGTYGLLAQYSNNGTSWATQEMCKTTPITIKSDYNYINICIIVFSGQTVDTTIYPMLCDPTVWAQSHDFQPYALPNYDLTRLEAEDRAALAEEIDAGAKNVLQISGINTSSANGVTFTLNSDGSITVNGTPSGTSDSYITISSPTNYVTWCDGKHYLSGCPKGGDFDTKYSMYFIQGGYEPIDEGDGVLLTSTTASSLNFVIMVRNGYTANNLRFYPMICTKAAFGVSPKFVPYKFPNNNLGYKTYEINLSAVTINKAVSGVYWYKISVSADFSKVVSVTLTDGKEIPNKRSFMPYVENGTGGAQAIGFLIADPDAPATMAFNDGAYMSLTAFGYLK